MADGKRDRDSDTIAAIATPPGIGAIGVIRLSGPDAIEIAAALFSGQRNPLEMKGFEAAHGWIIDSNEKLDEVVITIFHAAKSYTCENMVEISCHGGPIVMQRVLDALLRKGARLAQPGEFTKRAFLAGRIDLAQAEAIAALVASETDAASRAALAGLAGELSGKIKTLRAGLVQTLADLEAGLDFSEEDIEFISREKLNERLQAALKELDELGRRSRAGKILSQGVRLVIAGRPNVGKSTLMNALLDRDRVIVTPHPGTTRDVVEDAINIKGVPARISDTAGIGEHTDEIEREGINRTRRAIESADLIILMLDGSEPLTDYDAAILAETKNRGRVVLINKIDLEQKLDRKGLKKILGSEGFLELSAKTRAGIEQLKEKIERLIWKGEISSEDALVSTLRQIELLDSSRAALQTAASIASQGLSEEFIASEIRRGIELLGQITGESVSDEVLDIIFSRFCIGK